MTEEEFDEQEEKSKKALSKFYAGQGGTVIGLWFSLIPAAVLGCVLIILVEGDLMNASTAFKIMVIAWIPGQVWGIVRAIREPMWDDWGRYMCWLYPLAFPVATIIGGAALCVPLAIIAFIVNMFGNLILVFKN